MRLPQHAIRDADVGQQFVDVGVAAKERVQAGFEPIAVAVAPRREFSTSDIAFLEDQRRLAGIREILRGGKTGGTRPDDKDVGFGGCYQSTNSWRPATVGISTGIKPAMIISS